jgi:hypothetical protein
MREAGWTKNKTLCKLGLLDYEVEVVFTVHKYEQQISLESVEKIHWAPASHSKNVEGVLGSDYGATECKEADALLEGENNCLKHMIVMTMTKARESL